ncbi:hypothetical protein [Pontibacter harenae]|uniref:hypothetical protein n=1 Tax=Pontibacter harenae TaxID=2894083 RepID=UPI001E3C5F8C|nr:hypothetical protein [Pontibacter harenae]MCC9169165.1 hypothetical protein [Pontibacter harenae]
MAPFVSYSEYKDCSLACGHCGWYGQGRDSCQNYGGMVIDLSCPNCYEMLAVVEFPSYHETVTHGSEAERKAALREVNFRERFKRLSLNSPEQLPEIQESGIVFTFRADRVKGEDLNIVEHQGKEIWREPMVWEGYGRFMEIGRILKEKYGNRMVDLVPDATAEMFLYGDKLQAPSLVADFRKKLKHVL